MGAVAGYGKEGHMEKGQVWKKRKLQSDNVRIEEAEVDYTLLE